MLALTVLKHQSQFKMLLELISNKSILLYSDILIKYALQIIDCSVIVFRYRILVARLSNRWSLQNRPTPPQTRNNVVLLTSTFQVLTIYSLCTYKEHVTSQSSPGFCSAKRLSLQVRHSFPRALLAISSVMGHYTIPVPWTLKIINHSWCFNVISREMILCDWYFLTRMRILATEILLHWTPVIFCLYSLSTAVLLRFGLS
jgi:hypothetical protein